MIGGNNVSGEYFDGLIDNVRVDNRALVAEGVATMHAPGFYSLNPGDRSSRSPS